MDSVKPNKSNLESEIQNYLKYHTHAGNRLTHFFGIPLVLFSLFIIFAWFPFAPVPVPFSIATLFFMVMVAFYLRFNKKIALAFFLWALPLYILADEVAVKPFSVSFTIMISVFILGWIFQGVGHAIEKNRPAFFTNLSHLWRGPLFITYEMLKLLRIKF